MNFIRKYFTRLPLPKEEMESKINFLLKNAPKFIFFKRRGEKVSWIGACLCLMPQ